MSLELGGELARWWFMRAGLFVVALALGACDQGERSQQGGAPVEMGCEPLTACDAIFDGEGALGDEDPMGVTQVGAYEYRIAREKFRPEDLFEGRTCLFVPRLLDGEIVGMRLFLPTAASQGAKGLWQRLGFRRFDELRAVNGVLLTSAEHAMKAREVARVSRQVTVEVLREGREVTLVYEVR